MKKLMSCWKKMTAAILIAAMFFTSCEWPLEVRAAQLEEDSDMEESQEVEIQEEVEEKMEKETESPGIKGELTDLRSENSKQFLMEDGSISAVQYDADVHYQDEEGIWQKIDNSLTDEEVGDSNDVSGYSNKEGKVKYKFAKNANANFLVRIMQGEYHIFFSAKDTQKKAEGAQVLEAEVADESADGKESLAEQMEVENNRSGVVYKDLFIGTDVEYLLSGSSLKENIIVKEPRESYEYEFEIKTNKINIREEEDGTITFLKEDTEEVLYTIPQMYMWDAGGKESDAIEVELNTTNKKSILTIRADEEWINSEERIFPVTIDPTLQSTSTSVGDEARIVKNQYVCKGNPTMSSAGYGRGFLGYDMSGDKVYRLFVQFKKLPVIPENSVILGSKFYYGQTAYDHVGMSKLTIVAREVTENWTWGTKITWKTQPAYTGRVLDYQVLSSGTTGEYVGWDITKIIKEHYEKKDNTTNATSSFVLMGADESVYGNTCAAKASVVQENSAGFFSSAQPVLLISYRDTRGLEDYYTYQTLELGKAGTGYISDYAKTVTFVRPLLETTSTTIPFQLNLVYNSSIGHQMFGSDAGLFTKDFSSMQLGLGWKLNIQETIVEKTISGKKYLIWNDCNGTDHYFPLESGNTYKDEDGLKLTIVKNSTSPVKYTMADEKGNQKIFYNGFLSSSVDANGNALHMLYNGSTYSSGGTWYANTGNTNKLTSIVQVNNGQTTAKTITAFVYDSGGFLSTVTDASQRTYKFAYTASTDVSSGVVEKNLTKITEPDGTYIRYDYYTIGNDKVSKLARTYDSETKLGGRFRYTTTKHLARCCSFGTLVWTSETAFTEERRVDINHYDLQQVYYKDWGLDAAADTEDDIWTYCTFDTAGRTINQISMNSDGTKLYGASSTAYTGSSSGKQSNKVLSDITSGVGGINLLRNSGIEIVQNAAARGWTEEIHASTATAGQISIDYEDSTKTRSGFYSAQMHVGTGAQQDTEGKLGAAILSTASLEEGETYTFSGYFKNTEVSSFAEESRAYLEVRSAAGSVIAVSPIIRQNTADNIENGWSRLILTFTVPSAGTYTLAGCVDRIYGTSCFDDFQLEKGTGVSSYNHFSNGDAEVYDGWGKTANATRISGGAMHGEYCWKIVGSTTAKHYAYDYVYLNTSSDNTFVLSGWAQGAAGPGQSTTSSSGRAYGLEAVLYYKDGSTETHYVSFDGSTSHLQYVSLNVVPKKSGTIIEKAAVKYIYANNANTVYFDGISFRKEPVSCYKYDSDGNVTAVTSTQNEDVNFQYSAGNLIKTQSEGNGVYSYSYDNKHNLTKVTNDGVDMDLTYDSMGHVKTTKLQNTSQSGGKNISTSASYTADGDYLVSQTDALGNETSYETNSRGLTASVTDAMDHAVYYDYDADTDRLENVSLRENVGVNYIYSDSVLTHIVRESLLPTGAEKEQSYSFSYDTYDNVTSVKVGERTLAEYEYQTKNGPLSKITYGNGFCIEYEYDELYRVVAEKENGVLKYRYLYGAEGALTRQEELNASGTVTGATGYEYDSLGRLIRSWEEEPENGSLVRNVSTEHLYDTSDRLVKQSWKDGNDTGTESYVYNTADGTLSGMTTSSGETLSYTYDYLKRLAKRTDGIRSTSYQYQDVGETGTSTQVKKITQTGVEAEGLALEYEYDKAGNIIKVLQNGDTLAEYSYDDQYQLVQEVLPQKGLTYNYSYDTAGNIHAATETKDGAVTTRSYTYGDSEWQDLLTAVDGHGLTYDAIGNPLKYYNGKDWTFTWIRGRQLNTSVSGGTVVSYQYDGDGTRTAKTTGNEVHEYLYLGGQLVKESYGNHRMEFAYDEQGRPYSLTCDGTTYYYILNQQGDVLYITDEDGNIQNGYEYNAWGKVMEVTGSESIGEINPLRYRGYYYDVETGFYYVSSRYYDPEVGRFISADTTDILEVQDDLYDKNLYAYCDNNPVMRVDSSGAVWHLAVGAAVGIATQFISDVGIGLATGSSFGEIMSSLSLVDYASAAIGGVIAASGIGSAGAVVANATLGGTTYLANCSYKGVKANKKDFVASTVIGGVAGAIGGSGANGKNMRGVYSRSKQVINATKSARKQTMYKAKITTIKKNVTKSSVRTVVAGVFSNVGNFVRRLFSRSKA